MLSTRANTFLDVDRASCPEFSLRIDIAEKHRFELVHSRIREEKSWIVLRYDAASWDEDVSTLLEELEERLADAVRGPQR